MARPSWADVGGIWRTIREVDVNAIRDEAERGVTIACVGQAAALWQVERLLREGPDRYSPQPDPLVLVPLDDVGRHLDRIRGADALVVALDAAPVVDPRDLDALRTLSAAPRPAQVVFLVGGGAAGEGPAGPGVGVFGADPAVLTATPWAPYLDARLATFVDPDVPEAGLRVCGAVLDALPSASRLAAARRLPGLRPLFAANLTGEVSVSNAAFALASGVPSLVPFLGIPISAADTIVLTKNQALMVYRLALACGAPPEFQRRMLEITPVIGGAVVWRQVAGALAGLVPGYGLVPKTAVAFGGTYVVGLVATRWYETGFISEEDRARLTAEAAARAREVAAAMVAQTVAAGEKVGAQARDGVQTVGDRAAAAGAQARDILQKAAGGAAAAGAQVREAALVQARVAGAGVAATRARLERAVRSRSREVRDSTRTAAQDATQGLQAGVRRVLRRGDRAAGAPDASAADPAPAQAADAGASPASPPAQTAAEARRESPPQPAGASPAAGPTPQGPSRP